jgi:hypothetical protein
MGVYVDMVAHRDVVLPTQLALLEKHTLHKFHIFPARAGCHSANRYMVPSSVIRRDNSEHVPFVDDPKSPAILHFLWPIWLAYRAVFFELPKVSHYSFIP